MENEISLQTPNPDDTISMTDATSPVPTQTVTNQRSIKADYALGDASPGAPALSNAILSGRENDLRQNVANEEGLKWEAAKTALVTKIAQSGDKLSPEAADIMLHMTRQEYQNNPQDIFEKKFAEKYTDDTLQSNASNPNGVMQKAGAENPEVSSQHADVYSDAIRSNEYEKTQLENLHNEWQNTSWLSAAPQYVGQIIPLLSSWNLHNALAKAPTTSILPGDNLGQQIAYLKALPLAERKAQYDTALADLKSRNMLDALTFAQAVVSFNSTDAIAGNLMGIADAGSVGAVAAKGLMRLGTKVFRTAAKEIPEGVQKEVFGPHLTDKQAYDLAALQEMRKAADLPMEGEHTVFVHKGFDGAIKAADVGDNIATRSAGKDIPINKNTVYVSQDDAEKLRAGKGEETRIVTFKDGTLAKSVKQPDGQWSIPFDSGRVSAVPNPDKGLVPVELNDKKNIMGSAVYNDVRVHTPVDEVIPDIKLYTDTGKAGFIEHSPVAFEDSVAVRVRRNTGKNINNVTFGNPIHPVEFRTAQVHLAPTDLPPPAPGTVRFYHGGDDPTSGGSRFVTPDYNYAKNYRGGPNKVHYIDLPEKQFGYDDINNTYRHFELPEGLSQRLRPMDRSAQDLQVALKDGIRAVSDTKMDPAATLTQMGNVERAAQVSVAGDIARMQKGEATSIFDTLPSAVNPQNFFGTGKALSREFSQRIITRMTQANEDLLNLTGALHVPRGTEDAIRVGVQEATDRLKGQYGGRVNDGIIDFLHVPPELNPNKVNVDTVIMRLGNTNGLPFTDRASAEFARDNIYGLTSAESQIQQKGTSFYLTVARHVDETSQGFRDALVTPTNSTPVSMVNMLTNRLRSTEDLLATVQRDNRHIATHAPQRLQALIKDQLEETTKTLSGTQRKEVERVLIRNRDWVDPAQPDIRGRFFRSAAEFEGDFLQSIGHLPTAEQTAHYFNYTRLSDFEFMIRNLALYRDKARLAVQEFRWKTPNGDLPWFEGKSVDGIPWGGQDASIWLYEAGTKDGRLLYKHDMVNRPGGITKQGMEDLIKNKGFKVYQVLAPTKRPFSGVLKNGSAPLKEQIHFVVTNAMENRPLSFQQLEYRPGGHSIYPDKWFVKQPVIETGAGGKPHYYGDNAVMNFASEAQSQKYASAMDTARKMLQSNDPRLNGYIASNLPYTPADFKKMFQTGHLSLDHPIVATETGRGTFDTAPHLKTQYRDLVDATKSEYNLEANIDKSFQAERDLVLNSVKESGGGFQLAPSRQLDPYVAFNRAMGQAVRNLWMGDYKVQAVQSWLQEFEKVMKPDYKTLSNNPMYFLYHPQWNEGVTDKALLAAAKTAQRSIVNFVGAQSEIATQVTHIQNKLINSIYDKFGQKASEIVADHALPAIKDPAKYVRAVAFHTKLGLFNPIQLVVQAQSLVHVTAVAGAKNSMPGYAGAWFARRLLHNDDPAILADFARKATSFGWKADHFQEMVTAMKKSGLMEVAGETAMRDDIMDPKLYNSTLGRWLDKGTMFFAEGERIVRLSAFSTAYREWRLANPLAELTNREMGKVMSRSDLLSVNMTRASAATWQQGLASVPLQFMAFNARLAEQFLGKRLTLAEKAQALATYGVMYGVPTATAGALGVWPFYDDVKEAALRRGIDLSPRFIQSLMEGVPQTMLSVATGHDYNVAQRLGPNGANIFRDAVTGEKSVMQLLGGASGSIIGDIWSASSPVARATAGVFTGNSESFPLKTADWLAVLNNVSTFQLATRIQAWYSYGKYITKNNVQVGEMDGMDAAMSILGLTPKHIAETYTKQKALKADTASQKPYEDLVLKNWAMAVQAGANNDEQGFKDYMTRVSAYMAAGDFNVADQQKLYSRAMKYRPDLQDKINWDFVKNAPQSQYSARFNSFFTNQQKAK